MKTIDEFKKEFSSKLQSNTWKALKSSLLGKELISYAAQVLYESNVVNEALVRGLTLSSADESSYYAVASACDVPLNRRIPSAIKIKIPALNSVVSPYKICVQVGTVSFYNIDFVQGDQVITLYQGSLKTVSSSGENLYDWGASFNKESWSEYFDYTTSAYYSKYVKLSSYAYAPSVRVMARANQSAIAAPMKEYDAVLASDTANLYKVRVVRDGKVAVIFGNGIWGKVLESGEQATQIFYLDGTINTFDVDSIQKVSVGDVVYMEGEFEVLSSFAGYDCVASDLRDQILSENVLALTTKSAVRSFLNSKPFVVDSQVKADGSNVSVWIKPSDKQDVNFKDLQALLQLNGSLCTSYNVNAAKSKSLSYIVHYKDVSVDEQTAATNAIQKELGYYNTGFDTDFSCSSVQAMIRDYTAGYLYVNMLMQERAEASKEVDLLLKPTEGTIQIPYTYNNEGFLNAQEVRNVMVNNGVLSIYSSSIISNYTKYLSLGKYVIVEAGATYTLFNLDVIPENKSAHKKINLNDYIPELGEMPGAKVFTVYSGHGKAYLYSYSYQRLRVVEINTEEFSKIDTADAGELTYKFYEFIFVGFVFADINKVVMCKDSTGDLFLAGILDVYPTRVKFRVCKLNFVDMSIPSVAEKDYSLQEGEVIGSSYNWEIFSAVDGFMAKSNIFYTKDAYDLKCVILYLTNPGKLTLDIRSSGPIVGLDRMGTDPGRNILWASIDSGENWQIGVGNITSFLSSNWTSLVDINSLGVEGIPKVVSESKVVTEEGYIYTFDEPYVSVDLEGVIEVEELGSVYRKEFFGSVDYANKKIIFSEPYTGDFSYESNQVITTADGIYFELADDSVKWEEI